MSIIYKKINKSKLQVDLPAIITLSFLAGPNFSVISCLCLWTAKWSSLVNLYIRFKKGKKTLLNSCIILFQLKSCLFKQLAVRQNYFKKYCTLMWTLRHCICTNLGVFIQDKKKRHNIKCVLKKKRRLTCPHPGAVHWKGLSSLILRDSWNASLKWNMQGKQKKPKQKLFLHNHDMFLEIKKIYKYELLKNGCSSRAIPERILGILDKAYGWWAVASVVYTSVSIKKMINSGSYYCGLNSRLRGCKNTLFELSCRSDVANIPV